MRKFLLIFILLAAIGIISNSSPVEAYTFEPSGNYELYDLPHSSYFEWGINWILPQGETIENATISFINLQDWNVPEENYLYVHLLNSAPAGTTVFQDNEAAFQDAFAGQGYLFTPVYSDNDLAPFTLTYSVPTNLFGWIADGNFGFGIDPDCHFFNDGVSVTVNTVPEPAIMLMIGAGLIGLAGLGRFGFRRFKV